MSLRIYLDACCLNRPFDDCSQDRIRLEAEAVKAIVHRIEKGPWEGVSSPVLVYGAVDAFHLACAESSKADIFLSTDDRLIRRARRHQRKIAIEVENPLRWFERVVQK